MACSCRDQREAAAAAMLSQSLNQPVLDIMFVVMCLVLLRESVVDVLRVFQKSVTNQPCPAGSETHQ